VYHVECFSLAQIEKSIARKEPKYNHHMIISANQGKKQEGTMWNETFQFLPMDCRWIMIGDLIMIETLLDGSMSSCSRLIGSKKELAWANIISKYNIEDYFSRNDGPTFHEIVYGMTTLGFLLGWIGTIHSLI
jgi:hypothetical protein